MSKPEPRYSVGERVMIRSEDAPEYNCDNAVVISLRFGASLNYLREEVVSGWFYQTDKDCPGLCWGEPALRPRPKPATESFDELMSAVKRIGKEQCPS